MSAYHTNMVKSLTDWIDQNLDKPLLLDEIAIKSGYTKWHIQRVFKEVTGYSLAAYIRARKLTNAAILIRLTWRSINEIAAQFNFHSPPSFCRAFSQQFGLTPVGYRRMNKWSSHGIMLPFLLNTLSIKVNESVENTQYVNEIWRLHTDPHNDSHLERMKHDDDFLTTSKHLKQFSLLDQKTITSFLLPERFSCNPKNVSSAVVMDLNNTNPTASALLIFKAHLPGEKRCSYKDKISELYELDP